MASVVVDCPGDFLVGSSNDSLKELDSLFISLKRVFEQIGHLPWAISKQDGWIV